MRRAIYIVTGIVLLTSVGVALLSVNEVTAPRIAPETSTTTPVCAMDTMMCPDGSTVGRTGLDCTFAQCPVSTTTSDVSVPAVPAIDERAPVLDMGIGDASTPAPEGEACIREGGTWDPQYAECVGIRPAQCSAIGGVFDECASACRHNPEAEICTLQCVQVCRI